MAGKRFIFDMKVPFISLGCDKKQLIGNFFSLAILQSINYLLPLITLPYLVRVLGVEKFGLIVFAQAFNQYFNILIDFGFSLYGTRAIAINRDNTKKISEVFSSIMIVKILLTFISLIVLTMLVFSFQRFHKNWIVYYLTFLGVIGQALFPIWFFQGMEKMKYITILNVLSKVIFTILVFLIIKEPSEFLLVPLFNSSGYILASILSLAVIKRDFKLNFIVPGMKMLKTIFKEAFSFFSIRISTTVYTASGTFLVGIFYGDAASAYYAVAEKTVRILQWIMQPVFQSIFPYVSRLFSISYKEAFDFIKKVSFGVGIVSLCLSVLVFLFSDSIILLLFGKQYMPASCVLKIMAFIPFIGNLTHIFGVETLQASGHQDIFLKIVMKASVVYVGLAVVNTYLWDAVGVALTLLFVETLVLMITLKSVYSLYGSEINE